MHAIIAFSLVIVLMSGCGKTNSSSTVNAEELGNAVGQALADLDTSLASSTALAARVQANSSTLCLLVPFGACSSNAPYARTRDFNSCIWWVGLTLTGSETLTFSDSACALNAAGDTITRTFNWSLANTAGDAFAGTSAEVETYDGTKISGGQRLTKNSDGYTWEILGLTRTLTNSTGTLLHKVSLKTTDAIDVIDNPGVSRTVSDGTLVIYMNLVGVTATLTADDVTWDTTCTCPISGTVTGELTGAAEGEAEVEFTEDCGVTEVTVGGTTTEVTSNSCRAL